MDNGRCTLDRWLGPKAEAFVANISKASDYAQWIENDLTEKLVSPAEIRGLLAKAADHLDDAFDCI